MCPVADTHTPDAGGPVEAAREWFDRDRVVHDDRCTTHGRALAAAVRRLREQVGRGLVSAETFDAERRLREQAEAALAACRAAAGEQDIRLAGVDARADELRAAGGDPVEAYWAEAKIEALERELAEARRACAEEHPEVGRLRSDLAAARAEVAHAQQQYRDLHASYAVNVADHAAEVERAFRAGVMLIMVCPFTSADVDAAWSRYQQEREGGEGR